MKPVKPLGRSPAPEPKPARRRRTKPAATAVPAPMAADPAVRPNVLDLRVKSPFRLPDYRWQIALRLVNGEYVPRGWADAWVRVGERLLRRPEGSELPPGLAAAAEARAFLGRASDWKRAELEARLLASEPHGDIAGKVGLSAGGVEAYAALFYAVADRLGVSGYITHCVVGLFEDESDPCRHLRLYGYGGGPHVVDFLTAPDPGPGAPEEVRRQYELARLALRLSTTPVTAAKRDAVGPAAPTLARTQGARDSGTMTPAGRSGATQGGRRTMAWDSRGYYYRSRRSGGKVGRDYFGRGAVAGEADRLLGGFREAQEAEAVRGSRADAAFALLAGALDEAVAQRLAAAGYHRHDRGQWRKRRAGLPLPVPPSGPTDWAWVQSLALDARESWAGGSSERLAQLDLAAARLARPGAGPIESVLALRAALAAARLSDFSGATGKRARRLGREAAAAWRALRSVQERLPPAT